jgi:hypothetical protein
MPLALTDDELRDLQRRYFDPPNLSAAKYD